VVEEMGGRESGMGGMMACGRVEVDGLGRAKTFVAHRGPARVCGRVLLEGWE